MRGRPRSNYRNQPRFPVTVPRGSFRSFSGRRSPHANRKRNKRGNLNKVPIPYNYTDTQKWQTFYTNGREKFHKNCILLCDVSYGYVKDTFWKESHGHIRGQHAEVKALQRIMAKERDFESSIGWVKMYLSYSPCASCADRILQFSWNRPQCDITIAFSCLFRHTEKLHQDGLRRLNAESRITIKVFTKNDWKRLAQETDINFTEYAPRRDKFDAKWRAVLRQILSEEIDSQHIPDKPARVAPAKVIIDNNHIVPTHRSKPQSPSDQTIIQIFQIDSQPQDIPQNRRLQSLSITVPRRESHTSPSHPDSAQSTTNNETRIEIEEISGSIQGLRRKKKKQIIIITSFVILIAIATIFICIFCV